jgi:hypothetical protein
MKLRIQIFLLLLALILVGSGCGVNVGDSKNDSDNDNSNTNIVNSGSDIGSGNGSECEGVLSFDGAGGLLYKPQSESDGMPVLLFPSELDVEFESVLAETKTGDYVNCVFAGFTNPDRQTWRIPVEAAQLSGVFVVQATNSTCEVFVPNPLERLD